MKKLNILLLLIPFFFTSCIKDDVVKLTDQGSTFIVVGGAGTENQLFFDAFTDVKKISLFDIQRDLPSNAALNSSGTVTLTAAPDLIEAYNDENGTEYEWLPAEIYTTVDIPGVSYNGDKIVINYSAGDFAKLIAINLDGSKWDLAHKYAVAFRITDAGGAKIKSGNEEMIAFLSAKNKWDGIYLLEGHHLREPYTFPYEEEVHLVTASPTAVYVYWPAAGSTGHPIGVGEGESSWYGASISPGFEIDPETNEVVGSFNVIPGVGILLYSGSDVPANAYDPDTKTLTVNWFYRTATQEFTATGFMDKFTYIKAR